MDKLPCEITTNILSRLHFKLIGQCRCVSKLWYSLLNDTTFPENQLTHLSKIRSDLLLYYRDGTEAWFYRDKLESTLYYVEEYGETFNRTDIKPFKTFDSEFLSNSFDDAPCILGAWNGFICLSNVNYDHICQLPHNPIYVSNPITQEHSPLPHFTVPEFDFPEVAQRGKRTHKFLSGFGFHDSTEKFKLVLVIFATRDYDSQDFNNEVQVHTLGSTSWTRKLGVVPNKLQFSDGSYVAFVNGCLHWISEDEYTTHGGPLIISFDLGLEEFGAVPAPERHLLEYPSIYYKLQPFEGYLSIVDCVSEDHVGIWIMKNYGVQESWVKQYSVCCNTICRHGKSFVSFKLIKICSNGELLLLCDNQYLVSYNTTTRTCRFHEVDGVPKRGQYNLLAQPFVGSLISPKSICDRASEKQ